MSANAFEDLMMATPDTDGHDKRSLEYSEAFGERMRRVAEEHAKLKQAQQELRADEGRAASVLDGGRKKLENNSRQLSTVHARRARLQKELEQCDAAIVDLERQKVELTGEMHGVTTKAARQREAKLRELAGRPGGSPVPAPSKSAKPVNLLDPTDAAPPARMPAASATPPPDLLGPEVGPSGPAGSSAAELLAGLELGPQSELAGLALGPSPPLAPSAPAGAMAMGAGAQVSQPINAPMGGACAASDGGFAGFDLSQPPAGMCAPPGNPFGDPAPPSNPFGQPPPPPPPPPAQPGAANDPYGGFAGF